MSIENGAERRQRGQQQGEPRSEDFSGHGPVRRNFTDGLGNARP